MSVAVEAQSTMVEVVLAEAAMALSMDLPAEAVPGHSAALRWFLFRKKTDPYDVYDYDDPDDFAEEWAEDFGDGDYDDGYEDAYDYWEDEYDD